MCQCPVPVDTPEAIGLMTKLTHTESGQWQSSIAVVPLPKADPQGMGSAITYARRYALTAMLGLVTEDDEGRAALNEVPHARGVYPLCTCCEFSGDCPKFPQGENQPQWEPALDKLAALKEERAGLDTEIREVESALWYWDYLKWYTDDPVHYTEVDFIEQLISGLPYGDFRFIRIGEDYDDTEVRGGFWENPFDMELGRYISFSEAV